MTIGPTPVQTASAINPGTSVTVTTTSGVSNGNLLVAYLMTGGQDGTITTPTGWTLAAQALGGNSNIPSDTIYFCVVGRGSAPAAGTKTFTFTWSVNHSALVFLEEWNATQGWAAVTVLDQNSSTINSAATKSLSSGTTSTTTQATELWVGSWVYKQGLQTYDSVTAGWTQGSTITNSVNSQATYYDIVSSTGAASLTGLLHTTAERNAGAVATFMTAPQAAGAAYMVSNSQLGTGTIGGRLIVKAVTPFVSNSLLAGKTFISSGVNPMVSNSLLGAGFFTTIYPGAPYTATIGGAPVSVKQGTLDVTNQIGQRSTGTIEVWSALGTTWKYGTRVLVNDGSNNRVYSGYTSKDKATKASRQGHGYLEHSISLMDNCYKADKRLIFGEWDNMSAGAIVKAIFAKVLAAEGVTITANSIATGPQINQVVWNGKQVSQALTWLAVQSGFWWNIDVNSVLWYQPYGGIPAPFVLDGTQVSVDSNLNVTFGNDMFVNRQYVKGAHGTTVSRTETQKGDGNKQNFVLSYGVAQLSSIQVNGVTKQISTKGNSGADWYFAVNDSVIAQDTGGVVLGTSDVFKATYTGAFPILVEASSASLIAAQKAREGGGTGIVENEYIDAKITSQNSAFQIAGAILSHYGADMTQLEFDVLASKAVGLNEGQMLTVNLPDFGLVNTQMLVISVEITDSINESFNIYYHVTAVGAPVEAAQWQTYWQALQNQSADPSDFSSIDNSGGLALVFSSQPAPRSPTVTINFASIMCLICNTSTLCGLGQTVC